MKYNLKIQSQGLNLSFLKTYLKILTIWVPDLKDKSSIKASPQIVGLLLEIQPAALGTITSSGSRCDLPIKRTHALNTGML